MIIVVTINILLLDNNKTKYNIVSYPMVLSLIQD